MKPLRCKLWFHGKILWDKERVKGVVRKTEYGQVVRSWHIGRCLECGEQVAIRIGDTVEPVSLESHGPKVPAR